MTSPARPVRPNPNRPAGWIPPGPKPRGADGRPELAPHDDEDLAYLLGDFRIFQKKRGHRWSLDDFATAWVAIRMQRARSSPIARAADLGCGIGSVLMMIAWAFPDTIVHGVEAQDLSVELARRSLAYNGLVDRCAVRHGDLRDPAALEGRFDLVTGTPPYIPIGHGLVSERQQREPCFFETRGGIEDYALAAARVLADDGRFVVCGGFQPSDRGAVAAAGAGLHLHETVDVVPREGKPVLFRVFVMAKHERPGGPREGRFVVRDEDGKLAADMVEARREMGLPPSAAGC